MISSPISKIRQRILTFALCSLVNRGCHGTYYTMSLEHLDRCVHGSSGLLNDQPANALNRMATLTGSLNRMRLSIGA